MHPTIDPAAVSQAAIYAAQLAKQHRVPYATVYHPTPQAVQVFPLPYRHAADKGNGIIILAVTVTR